MLMTPLPGSLDALQADLRALDAAKDRWARTPVAQRIALLGQIKDALMQVAPGWAETAARKKRLPSGWTRRIPPPTWNRPSTSPMRNCTGRWGPTSSSTPEPSTTWARRGSSNCCCACAMERLR